MFSKNPKSQFIYGLLSTAIFFFCFASFMLVTNVASYAFPDSNEGNFRGTPYQICNGLSGDNGAKASTNPAECIAILTKENQVQAQQSRVMGTISSVTALVITGIVAGVTYKISKKLPNETETNN